MSVKFNCANPPFLRRGSPDSDDSGIKKCTRTLVVPTVGSGGVWFCVRTLGRNLVISMMLQILFLFNMQKRPFPSTVVGLNNNPCSRS